MAISARAQSPSAATGHGYGVRSLGVGMFDNINLDDDQTYEVAGLRGMFYAKTGPLRDAIKAKSAELDQLWKAAQPDKKAILAKSAEIESLSAKVKEARVELAVNVLKILTAKQRALLPPSFFGRNSDEHAAKS